MFNYLECAPFTTATLARVALVSLFLKALNAFERYETVVVLGVS